MIGHSPRAVVFDVGNVLFHWDLRALFATLIDDPVALDHFTATVITPEWHFQADAGRPLAEMIAERKAEFPDSAALIDAYAARFNETLTGPVAGMIEIVERLDGAGVPLYAITNFGHEFWGTFCPTQPVFDRFRDIVVSGTEHVAKPDPAIFHLALDRFGLAPHEALFVDDSADNIAAAETLGIAGHLFTGARPLCARLSALGLL